MSAGFRSSQLTNCRRASSGPTFVFPDKARPIETEADDLPYSQCWVLAWEGTISLQRLLFASSAGRKGFAGDQTEPLAPCGFL